MIALLRLRTSFNIKDGSGCEISESLMVQAMPPAHTHVESILDAQIQAKSSAAPSGPPKPSSYILSEEDKIYSMKEFVGKAEDVHRRSMSAGKDGRVQLEEIFREGMANKLREDRAWGSRHSVERSMAGNFVFHTVRRSGKRYWTMTSIVNFTEVEKKNFKTT
eukprot:gene27064-32702_t